MALRLLVRSAALRHGKGSVEGVDAGAKVRDLKAVLKEVGGVDMPVETMRVLFMGKRLDDNDAIRDAGIKDGGMCVCVCLICMNLCLCLVCVSLEKKTMPPAFLSISFLCRTINQHVSASLSLSLSLFCVLAEFWFLTLSRGRHTHTHERD